MTSKSKARPPVEKIEIGKYYFMILQRDNEKSVLRNPMCNPTAFELVKIIGLEKRSCKLISLCNLNAGIQYNAFAFYDFYPAAQKEVQSAKKKKKRLEYQKVDSIVDPF